MRIRAAILVLGLVSPAFASAPETSLRPVAKPVEISVTRAAPLLPLIRPQPRPQSDPETTPAIADTGGPATSLRPWLRPDSVTEKALFKRRKLRKGSVCGVIDIQGEKIGNVPGKIKGCGVKDAVKITSISGVKLSRGAIMDCPTAQALNQWVVKGVKPTFRRRGPVVSMRVAAHYACRTRNNQPGARISEHGRGRAIDISAFTMMDGEEITVLKGWGQGTTYRLLSKVHQRACGPFGTVLGPKSDRFHRDHFHLDTARYRSGPYCR
jgi:hypothetical protein